ncbi:MAG: DUF4258 domain-containing protein [Deltaproteobacteria bacterium]|nr:DUF4258 domain-containing protein [Deltaproteobacteria bacterium]
MEFSKHFNQMLEERNIRRDWVDQALEIPDDVEDVEDGTKHYIKQIHEYGNRWLRVVINVQANPNRAVTAFFDRRLRRTRS